MSLENVFHLNKCFLFFFQQGYLDCAIASLEAALYELAVQDIFLYHTSAFQNAYSTNCPSKNVRLLKWTKICIPGRISNDGSEDESSMYNYALSLFANPHLDSANEGSRRATRAALEYNLAYIHHWRAMHLGTSSDLTTALGHYECAWNAIKLVENGPSMEHLSLAVLNNTVHIHRQLMHNSQARNCLGVLRLLLSKLAGSQSLLETMEDYDTFIMSALMPTTDLEIAPAA